MDTEEKLDLLTRLLDIDMYEKIISRFEKLIRDLKDEDLIPVIKKTLEGQIESYIQDIFSKSGYYSSNSGLLGKIDNIVSSVIDSEKDFIIEKVRENIEYDIEFHVENLIKEKFKNHTTEIIKAALKDYANKIITGK
jgi:hypothetical protein